MSARSPRQLEAFASVATRTPLRPGSREAAPTVKGSSARCYSLDGRCNADAAPVLHLRRTAEGGLFNRYAESFKDVWQPSRPASPCL